MSQIGDREDTIMPGGIAMLLQHHVDAGVTPEAVRDQMLADWPDLGPITVMPPSDMDDEDGAVAQFSLECGNAIIIVTTMDSQFADDTAELCAGSRLWPDAATFDTDYQATTIVAVYFEDEDAADLAVRALLTQAMASIIAVSNEAFAVYWGDADHVIIPPLFREMAQEILPNPPLYLWVAFNAGFREGGEFASTTVGLDSLGLMDIEIPDSSKTPEDTQEFILNLVIYLLETARSSLMAIPSGRVKPSGSARYTRNRCSTLIRPSFSCAMSNLVLTKATANPSVRGSAGGVVKRGVVTPVVAQP